MHFIYKMEKGKEKTKQKMYCLRKRTAKDMNATIVSFNELVVAGGVLLFRKLEEKVFSLIRSLIFFAV